MLDRTDIEIIRDLVEGIVSRAVSGLATKEELNSLRAEMATKEDLQQGLDSLNRKIDILSKDVYDFTISVERPLIDRLDEHEERIELLEKTVL